MLAVTIPLGLLAAHHALAKRHKDHHDQGPGYHISLPHYSNKPSLISMTAPSTLTGSPTIIDTYTITSVNTAATTSSTSSDSSQTNFYILDAQEESEIQLWPVVASNSSGTGYTTFWTLMPPDDFLGGLTLNLFTLNEKGNLIYVGPTASLAGRAAYTDGYWFLFLDPESDAAQQYELCTCAIDPATWQLSCNCGGVVENCNTWLIEQDSCRLWYAHPYSQSDSGEAPSTTTREPPAAIRSSSTTRHLAQPTFAIHQEKGLGELGFSSSTPIGTNESIAFTKIFPIGSQQPLTFTLNERGNLILITPGLSTTGYIAYGDEHDNFVFARPGNNALVGARESICSIDGWAYQFKCGYVGDPMIFCNLRNSGTGELVVCPGVDWDHSWVNLYAVPVIPT
ncbi:hypothetical protein PFICI_15222 [Pestalotiopsis fici W106-1]|uniref:Uncharacterized protein n=1 Tax=Pestalotiopsis fici (strain W106-1 / CGMCC3.15140) TaxID=1229662 RepID=W3WIQ9_PESFW|nr:uncharacterized protein PFICI_15222 [Pestalotiopsis fici W106-1]ETS73047.1 hypothetical protein PFICI_15222 [Pestalotiopsis fici W106-1]